MNKERIILVVGVIVVALALLFVWHKDKMKEEQTVPLWTPPNQSQPVINANKAAVETKKKTVFFFTSPVCPPCERMKRSVFPNAEVQKLLNNYVFQTVDVTVDRQTANKFQIKVTPTLIMVDGDKLVKPKQEGAMTVEQLVAWLQPTGVTPPADAEKEKPKDAPEKKGLSNLFRHRN